MGRVIRNVPKGWEHPRDEGGKYIPMFDQSYDDAAKEWLEGLMAWENKTDATTPEPDNPHYERYYWDYSGMPPDCDSYRPAFTSEPDHYQVYEDVSEGTPISPVFKTEGQMFDWIVQQGYSKEAAQNFIKSGWAMSGLFVGSKESGYQHYNDIESCAVLHKKDD